MSVLVKAKIKGSTLQFTTLRFFLKMQRKQTTALDFTHVLEKQLREHFPETAKHANCHINWTKRLSVDIHCVS